MKKSECFRLAQEAVIEHPVIATHLKIEILRVLIQEEDMFKYCEQEKERKAQTVDSNGKL